MTAMHPINSMKAIVYRRYGSPDVLELEDIETLPPGDDEILIKVLAASVNPLDWHFMRGTPYLMRIMIGLRKPKSPRLGVDVAGQVQAVGRNVSEFRPGDAVFGACRGAFAEYASASVSEVVTKPDSMTFEQAASVNVAALTALQALRDAGRIQAGHKVLINGAAGGVGTFAVQIAKSFGADVTGVCSARNVDMVRSMGADRVIDYNQEDFTKGETRYDLVLDCIGNHSLSECRRILSPTGICVMVGGPSSRWGFDILAFLIQLFVLSRFSRRKLVTLLAKGSKKDLTIVRELIEAGKITPIIDRRYRLSEVPEAIRYLEKGHARGKVIITVEDIGHARETSHQLPVAGCRYLAG